MADAPIPLQYAGPMSGQRASWPLWRRVVLAIVAFTAATTLVLPIAYGVSPFQHIGILSLEFHVDKLSRPLL